MAIYDIEELLNTRITPAKLSNKFSPAMLERMDQALHDFEEDYTQDMVKVLKKNKLSIKLIDVFHRYQELINSGKMKKNDEMYYHLIVKKDRGFSGVEVIAVSTYPMGKFAGCPADCFFCPKEPEMTFPIILQEIKYEDETYISFQLQAFSSEWEYYVDVVSSITINGKKIPIERIIRHHKTIIATFLKSNFEVIPENGTHVMAYKTSQPRSYLSKEPAVARANQNGWDCVNQFRDIAVKRIHCGHPVTKVEGIVIGGTWSFYPVDYQREFIRDFYFAANTLYDDHTIERKSLEEEIKINQTSKCRVIGLTLETRPDFITPAEIIRFRSYGCTRVQLGIQHTDNKILKKINRGCTHEQNAKAIKLLKDAGFKVDIHLMPDLPSSSFWADVKMFEKVLYGTELQADQWKIYPCQTLEFTRIKEWYEKGTYKPYYEERKTIYFDNVYLDEYYRQFSPFHEIILFCLFVLMQFGVLLEIYSSLMLIIPLITLIYLEEQSQFRESNPLHHLLTYVVPRVHPWIRLNRIIRDNPEKSIVGGLNKSHYRNEIEDYLEKTGEVSQDIRYREIKNREYDEKSIKLITRCYESSGGLEYFLSIEDTKNNYLLGFLRLRIPEKNEHYLKELSYTALIRELHVYGWMVPQGEKKSIVQHRGFGKQLLKEAEKLARLYGFKRVAVISGEGVREYYQRQGYHTEGTYEIKLL